MSWRNVADWAKERPTVLRAVERLGRSRARVAVLNGINPPPKARIRPDLRDWQSHPLAAAWIGHATVLLRVGGKTILTDPVFSSRVGVGLGLMTVGPRRLVAPALKLRELPPIDLILISHAHFDHLDRPTLHRLPKSIPVVTANLTADLIRDLGFPRVEELAWGQSTHVAGLKFTAQPVVHWGARMFNDRDRGYNAYLIEAGGKRILYGGDTAYHEGFRTIDGVDLAIFGIGAYNPYIAAHATPEQAWEMADHCKAERIVPIHHSTFLLSYEPVDEPMQRMLTAAGAKLDRVVIREIGGMWRSEN